MKLIGVNITAEPNRSIANHFVFLSQSHSSSGARWFSAGDSESIRSAFSSQSAYEVLGVPETSSLTEIKASFRKLAKETHPDLIDSTTDPDSSRRFVQILAAYEILSDSEKRTHYDMYLFAQRKPVQRKSRYGVTIHSNESHDLTYKHMEVVEWLKWYRFAIKDILLEKREVVGNGYFDVLERDFYSAVHQAYYGPAIESLDFLPDRFEAEERSVYETPEVLHLVSGRDLFGTVCIVKKFPELPFCSTFKLRPPVSLSAGTIQNDQSMSISLKFDGVHSSGDTKFEYAQDLQAHSDLELRLYGRTVAMATRVPPISCSKGVQNSENEDRIHVFLCPEGCSESVTGVAKDSLSGNAAESRIPLGTIAGLGSSPDEGSCFVYDSSGTKTHVIMKHRTLLVKHMHWYGVGDKVSLCECRCSRAKLPPSKFWLFEPRCGMHDIGGWYIETFGRDKKGRTVPSQRFWDGFDPSEKFEKRVHPAMYLLALAYRTLDLEEAKIRKQTVIHHVERRLSKFLSWCKKLV